MDFCRIAHKFQKGVKVYYPEFLVNNTGTDLMNRGGAFYGVWDQEKGLWSTNEYDVGRMIDQELRKSVNGDPAPENCRGETMESFGSQQWTTWRRYLKSLPDKWKELDANVVFSNTEVTKESYASRKLPYPLAEGDISAYDEMIGTLYAPEERQKIEWAIGAIITGDSKYIQKFLVLYGSGGTGKSTVLNIIQSLFEGYYCVFEAKALASNNNQFALETFKNNPLLAIQHDGDLSRIEDNTKLNSIISHEKIVVNEKFKGQYELAFHSFLMMGTNTPVRITDAKSGIIRRLIDVHPSGNKIPYARYNDLKDRIRFELGAIAFHCLKVYESMGPHYYDTYVPVDMISATNDFFDFVEYHFEEYKDRDCVTLDTAWRQYGEYIKFANMQFSINYRKFKEELKNYFEEVVKTATVEGVEYKNLYRGFKTEKFESKLVELELPETASWLNFEKRPSVFDIAGQDYPAQYANDQGTPYRQWDQVTTTLADIDTSQLHYCKMPLNHIVIDFDLKNSNGEKDIEKNIRAASKFPPTYAELSKSGQGIHLHYFYEGDVNALSSIFDRDIEVKVFAGNQSLRRKLTRCNSLQIATLNGGLPLKEVKKRMINGDNVKNEKAIRTIIEKNLNKIYFKDTSSSVNYIYDTLEDAYASGISYDVSDLANRVFIFASQSHNQSDRCMKLVGKMKFASKNAEEGKSSSNLEPFEEGAAENTDDNFCFYDVEVAKNYCCICYGFDKELDKDPTAVHCVRFPTADEATKISQYPLIGFNNTRYDNHIVYGRMMGYDQNATYTLSDRLIHEKGFNGFFEAKKMSVSDIYDFARDKQSLKKWEIQMLKEGIPVEHHELGLKWDEEWPEEVWDLVDEYCKDDVRATWRLFHYLKTDWKSRCVLAELSGCTRNDSNNTHTKRLIFGPERNPGLCYTDLATGVIYDEDNIPITEKHRYYPMLQAYWDKMNNGKPIKNDFPGYIFATGKDLRAMGKTYLDEDGNECEYKEDDLKFHNWYRGEDVGFGGYVHAEPGMYPDVALLDIASMHPHSALAMLAFGPYTKQYENLIDARVHIKHEEYSQCESMFDGKLMKFLDDPEEAYSLSTCLKLPINSVYGLTSASFKNEFKDDRNVNNIIALRGALFMINLKHEVKKRGFVVAHIKTDSIKIPNATPEIIQFVMDYGKQYGYTFEHEATYSKMCLVNRAVYIARYAKPHIDKKTGREIWWTATGAEFQVPYVFKTLFSKEPITFFDLTETKAVTSALYLDMNENLAEGEHDYQFVGRVGLFCPVKEGHNGGLLMRQSADDKYAAATGTTGWRWLEADYIRKHRLNDAIDERYFIGLCDAAKDHISAYGSFERFVSDEPLKSTTYYDFPPDDELPF